jgi:hypothetical protein
MRCLRLGNLRTLFRDRYGPILPDDDAGREDLRELLLPVSLGREAEHKLHNIIETWAPWMDVSERFDLIALIERTPAYDRRVKATTLGKRLRVTGEERERLRLWTIAPFDLTDKQLKEQREAKHRARMQRRRRAAGSKPRDQSLNKLKPWETAGVSRRTRFRNQAKTRGTDSCAVKLLISRARTSATEKPARPPRVAKQHNGGKAETMLKGQSKPKGTEKQHGHEPLARPQALSTKQCQAALGADLRQLALSADLSHAPNGHGAVTMRVFVREIRHPAIKSGPDDNLDDFKIAARMTGFL